MEAKLRIFRFNPETDKTARYEDYPAEVSKGKTILDCLEEIRMTSDETLAFDRSCGSGICGGCGLRINGKAKLACQTQALNEVSNGEILVEPLSNFPIIKDLVVNKSSFWKKIKESEPCFVHKEFSQEDPNKLITKESLLLFENSENCILCGLCHSVCSSAKYEPNFLGPAAATKMYRFIVDPRDGRSKERLIGLLRGRIWSCSHQYQCIDACPKDIEPGNLIFRLESRIFEKNLLKSAGSRNAKHFEDSLKKYGRLDFRNWGIMAGNPFLKELVLNIQLARKSRLSLFNTKRIKNYLDFKRIFRKMGDK